MSLSEEIRIPEWSRFLQLLLAKGWVIDEFHLKEGGEIWTSTNSSENSVHGRDVKGLTLLKSVAKPPPDAPPYGSQGFTGHSVKLIWEYGMGPPILESTTKALDLLKDDIGESESDSWVFANKSVRTEVTRSKRKLDDSSNE